MASECVGTHCLVEIGLLVRFQQGPLLTGCGGTATMVRWCSGNIRHCLCRVTGSIPVRIAWVLSTRNVDRNLVAGVLWEHVP